MPVTTERRGTVASGKPTRADRGTPDSRCPAWVLRTLGRWRLGRFPITTPTTTEGQRIREGMGMAPPALVLGGVFHPPAVGFTTTLSAWMNQAKTMWGRMFATSLLPAAGFFFMARTGATSPHLLAEGTGTPWAQPPTPGRPRRSGAHLETELHCASCRWGGSLRDLHGLWACPQCGGAGRLHGGPLPRFPAAARAGRVLLFLAFLGALSSLTWLVLAGLGLVPLNPWS